MAKDECGGGGWRTSPESEYTKSIVMPRTGPKWGAALLAVFEKCAANCLHHELQGFTSVRQLGCASEIFSSQTRSAHHHRHSTLRRRQWDRPVCQGRSTSVSQDTVLEAQTGSSAS